MEVKEHAPSTAADYRYYVDHYIDPELGSTKLEKLSIERLEQFYTHLEERGLAGSTRHQCHPIIHAALKQAVLRGYVGRNVASLVVNKPALSKPRTETLSDGQLKAILDALEGDPLEARWIIALNLGLPPAEACSVEWSDINFESGTLSVRR